MAELIDTPLLPEVPSHIRPRHADVTRSLPTTPSPSESDVVRQQALSEPPPTREAGAGPSAEPRRSGEVPPLERAELRSTVGWVLYGQRASRGWSQEVLAARAKVSITSVRELERGQVRPSDRMCRRLAEGLAFDRDALSVAVLDLRLQRAAGPSLRRWHRRRPPRVAVRQLYAEAAAVIDAEDAKRQAEQQASAAAFLEEFRAQWRADAASAPPPATPAEAWPGRWPRVRG